MKRTGNKRGLLLAVLLPLLGAAQPGGGTNPDTTKPTKHEFTIQQAVDYAKKNNLNVKNALLDVQYQEQVNKEVTSRAYPGINASLGTTYNPNIATQVIPNFISPSTYQVLIDQGVKDGSGNPIQMPADFGFIAAQFGTKYSATAGIALSQLLFDGQVFVGLQARDATMRFARKNVEVTEEMIKTNIYKIYYQLVVSKTQVELLDANIERLEKLLKDTKIIYENGFAEKLDIDKLNVALTNLRTEKGKVMNSISNGYYGLKVLIGMPVKDELVLTEQLTDEQIKDGILEASVYKYEDRKEFQYAQIGKELNEFNIKRYKLSQIPTISLSGQYAKNAQRNKWNFFGKGDWFTISSVNLNMAIPIFNGFYTKAKIQQTRIDLRKTENQIEALRLSIDSEVETAKNNYRSAISTMDYQKKNMELAETVYQQTKKKYEVGTGSQTEINAAQVELKTAQTSFITALYDAVIARIDFLKATGKL
ncbi:MAG TPA: TolC family protein [Chitinophagaceae bacterium]|nr:TolC family protein [Chitinophagaceae bacterium]